MWEKKSTKISLKYIFEEYGTLVDINHTEIRF